MKLILGIIPIAPLNLTMDLFTSSFDKIFLPPSGLCIDCD